MKNKRKPRPTYVNQLTLEPGAQKAPFRKLGKWEGLDGQPMRALRLKYLRTEREVKALRASGQREEYERAAQVLTELEKQRLAGQGYKYEKVQETED